MVEKTNHAMVHFRPPDYGTYTVSSICSRYEITDLYILKGINKWFPSDLSLDRKNKHLL